MGEVTNPDELRSHPPLQVVVVHIYNELEKKYHLILTRLVKDVFARPLGVMVIDIKDQCIHSISMKN